MLNGVQVLRGEIVEALYIVAYDDAQKHGAVTLHDGTYVARITVTEPTTIDGVDVPLGWYAFFDRPGGEFYALSFETCEALDEHYLGVLDWYLEDTEHYRWWYMKEIADDEATG